MVGGALLGLPVEGAGTAGGGGDTGGPVDVHGGRVQGDAAWQQQPAGGDQVVQYLVAVGEVLPAGGGFEEEGSQVLGGEELPAGVVEPGVVAAVGGDLGLELGDLVGGADDSVQLAGGLQVADDAGIRRLVVEVPRISTGVSNLACTAVRSPAALRRGYSGELQRTWSPARKAMFSATVMRAGWLCSLPCRRDGQWLAMTTNRSWASVTSKMTWKMSRVGSAGAR